MGAQLGNSVEFYVGPPVLGAPDDLDAVIRGLHRRARKTVARSRYRSWIRGTITDALLAAKKAQGARAQSSWRATIWSSRTRSADPWTTGGDYEANRSDPLGAAAGRRRRDHRPEPGDLPPEVHRPRPRQEPRRGAHRLDQLHADRHRHQPARRTPPRSATISTTSWCCTASAPPTSTWREFERLRSGTFGELHERVEPRPAEFQLGKIRVKPVFAPEHGPEMEIMKQMLKAKTSIDFAMFTFAQSSGIDDTMIRLVHVADRIRGVLDRGQGAADVGGDAAAKAGGRAAVPEQARHRRPQGPPQADGDRRTPRHRRQLQLHRPGDHAQRREHHRARRPRGDRSRRRGRATTDSPATRSPRSTASSPICANQSDVSSDRLISSRCPLSSPRRSMSFDRGCSVLSVGCVAVESVTAGHDSDWWYASPLHRVLNDYRDPRVEVQRPLQRTLVS